MTFHAEVDGAPLSGPWGAAPQKSEERHTAVEIEGLSHWFVNQQGEVKVVLREVSLHVHEHEFIAIIGASGCGKTTILNLVAGLERQRRGRLEISVRGTPVRTPSPRVGYMWARDALLPWRTLQRNVEFGLEVRGIPRRERRGTAKRFIELVGLNGAEGRYPSQLSQGMRQRGNLSRLLATQPEFLLMDEPFSALDAQTKIVLQKEFIKIWEAQPQTVIYVTHDLNEAAALADRVVIMGEGFIAEEIAVPFQRPRVLDELRFEPEFVEFTRMLWTRLEQAKGQPR